jgi:hypothetical protein
LINEVVFNRYLENMAGIEGVISFKLREVIVI